MKKKGSITIFLVMLLTCFFPAVFAFLEAARVSGLKANARISTLQARDTVLASYNRDLWQRYHLLFWKTEGDFPELGSLAGLQQSAIAGNRRDRGLMSQNYYVLQVDLKEVETTAYELATDNGGAAFRRQAAEMMKETAGEDVLRTLINWLEDSDGTDESGEDLETKALDALEDLEQAGKESEEQAGQENPSGESGMSSDNGSLEIQESEIEISENPLEWVRKVQKNGIYAFLMPEEDISQKSIELGTCIGRRDLEEGNLSGQENGIDMEKLLFRLYLDKYFLDASEEASDHALDYELEYMIVGKAGDEANLKGTVRRLLLIREVANLAFLETDTEKRQETAAIAMVLTSAVGHPELQPVVQQGIMAAWAYAESLSDMRILLDGGKVMPVKTGEQWHTDIFHLSSSFAETDAGEQQEGLSYSNYLQILMWTISDQRLAERGMDMIEKNIDIQMDHMLSEARCVYAYEARSVFWDFVTLGQYPVRGYQMEEQTEISFQKDE